MEDPAVNAAIRYIRELFKNNTDGHDAEHSIRVYRNAVMLAQDMPGCNVCMISLAALLHDADDDKLFHTEKNANARSFLQSQNISEEEIEWIIRIINSVSFSKNRGKVLDTAEAKIVQDADRLDAIGAIGIARAFAYGGKRGRSLSSSVQHFYDKLLLLKDEMNTPKARQIAEKRHSFMKNFLDEMDAESNRLDL